MVSSSHIAGVMCTVQDGAMWLHLDNVRVNIPLHLLHKSKTFMDAASSFSDPCIARGFTLTAPKEWLQAWLDCFCSEKVHLGDGDSAVLANCLKNGVFLLLKHCSQHAKPALAGCSVPWPLRSLPLGFQAQHCIIARQLTPDFAVHHDVVFASACVVLEEAAMVHMYAHIGTLPRTCDVYSIAALYSDYRQLTSLQWKTKFRTYVEPWLGDYLLMHLSQDVTIETFKRSQNRCLSMRM
jgi:hypothetical protein